MKSLLHRIIEKGNGKRFYRFGNADGKNWVIPAENMRVALNLYQPSGRNGKLLKSLLPILHRLPIVRKAINAETFDCTLQKELHDLLCSIFKTRNIEFAIFEGTPSVHKKITMQLSCGNRILGYCKISDNKDIMSLFERESEILKTLQGKGIKNIPQPLYCGCLGNDIYIFVQSTEKTEKSRIIHHWGEEQENFLANLNKNTIQNILFEDSDFYESLMRLQEHIDWLPANIEKTHIETAINGLIGKYSGKIVGYSAFHADFTPWNMFMGEKGLFVFDFEYAALTYPPGLDKYHFELQTAIFERHCTKEAISNRISNLSAREKELMKMYLLDVISRFTLREGKMVEGEAATPFEMWGTLLKECN